MSDKICIHEWAKIEGIFALTQVEKRGLNITFNPGKGVPAIVEVCSKCGELRLYSAKMRGRI